MLKISLIDSARQRRLIVEGKLIAPWAAELRKACQEARAEVGLALASGEHARVNGFRQGDRVLTSSAADGKT